MGRPIMDRLGWSLLLALLLSPSATLVPTPSRNPEACNKSTDASKIISFLEHFTSLTKDAEEIIENLQTQPCGSECEPIDCAALVRKTNQSSGVYTIRPRSRVVNCPIQVMCDMEDGGGWTVIQRRGDFNSSVDYFYRDWHSYKTGFGDLEKDFWIGNDILHALTNQRLYSLKIVLSDFDGNTTYATYDEFWIEDENNNYKLRVSGYRGDAGDSFENRHNGAPFSTKDRDNDSYGENCAKHFKGAWWYTDCHSSNLNGQYLRGPHTSYADGVNWRSFRGHNYSLKDTIMKIRPKDFVLRYNL